MTDAASNNNVVDTRIATVTTKGSITHMVIKPNTEIVADDVSEVLDSVRALLSLLASFPCLTLIAGYQLDVPKPDWDISYPSNSPVLQLLAVDSNKRATPKEVIMVYQALPRWSAAHLDEAPDHWQAA